jgi:hypothetical protein
VRRLMSFVLMLSDGNPLVDHTLCCYRGPEVAAEFALVRRAFCPAQERKTQITRLKLADEMRAKKF